MKTKLITFSLLATLAPALHAATIITPSDATSTSFQSGGNRTITKTIDGSGLADVSDPLSELDDVHPYLSSSTDSPYWLSSVTAPNEELTFSFDQAYDIGGVYYWKYTRDARRNLQTFDISFSIDNGDNFSIPVSAASLNMADWSQSLGTREDSFAELRTFDTLTGITDIRFSNITAYGGAAQLLGLHEIRFSEAAAIPEPSTALLGLAGLALILRRRK